MLADRSLSSSSGWIAQGRRSSFTVVLCLSLVVFLIPLLATPPGRADIRKQVRTHLARQHHISHEIRRLRRLIGRLKTEQRELGAALDASQLSLRGVESAAMLDLWRGMSELKVGLRDAKRKAKRMGRLRQEIEQQVRQL